MSNFLDDQVLDLYDSFMDRKISARKFQEKYGELIAEKLNSDPTLTNIKRVATSLNLAVDRIIKKYGRSLLKKVSYERLYNKIFNNG